MTKIEEMIAIMNGVNRYAKIMSKHGEELHVKDITYKQLPLF